MNLFRPKVIVGALPVTLTNGTTADATQVMSDLNWLVNQVNANAAPLAGTALTNANNNFTVVQSGVAATDGTNFPISSQVQNNVFNTLSSTLGTNTLTSRVAALALQAYSNGQIFTFIPSQINSGDTTMSINGLAAKHFLNAGSSLSGGELRPLIPMSFVYDSVRDAFPLLEGTPYVKGPNIPSAATLNLDAVEGDYNQIDGTAGISAITLSRGRRRELLFGSSSVITNGASLLLSGGAPITTLPGDTASVRGEASGVVRMVQYQRAGAPASGGIEWIVSATVSNQATLDLFWSAAQALAVDIIQIKFVGVINTGGGGNGLLTRFSTDGATFDSGNNYQWSNQYQQSNPASTTNAGSGGATSSIQINQSSGTAGGSNMIGNGEIGTPSSSSLEKYFTGKTLSHTGANGAQDCVFGGMYTVLTPLRGIRLIFGTANITGTIYALGVSKS